MNISLYWKRWRIRRLARQLFKRKMQIVELAAMLPKADYTQRQQIQSLIDDLRQQQNADLAKVTSLGGLQLIGVVWDEKGIRTTGE